MSILGFSHIVTEVSNIDKSLKFYSKLGFKVDYKLIQKNEVLKNKILFGRSKKVQIYYLKNSKSNCIGIELIKHDDQTNLKRKNKLIFGYSDVSKKKIKKNYDPDGNLIIQFPRKYKSQNIIIPTNNYLKTSLLFKNSFRLDINPTDKIIKNLVKENYDSKKILSLSKKDVLFKNWDLNIHIVKVNQRIKKKYLNQIGFSCLCVLLNERIKIVNNKINKKKLVGPYFQKVSNSQIKKKFEYGFIFDINEFFTEYYINK